MTDPLTTHSDLRPTLDRLLQEFPFECELSIQPLIQFWDREIAGRSALRGQIGRMLQDELKRVPELHEPIHDEGVLSRHRDIVHTLMSAVFAPVTWDLEPSAALIPFQLKSFYATPAFTQQLMAPDGGLRGRLNVDKRTIKDFRLLNAYSLVLGRVHGLHLPVEYPLIFTTEDPDTGLDRHFKIHFDGR